MRRLTLPALAASFILIACGGSSESPPTGSTSASSGSTAASGAGGSGGSGGGSGGASPCPSEQHLVDAGVCDTAITWTAGPPVAKPRDHHGTFLVDPGGTASRFLYVAGGFSQASSTLLSDVARVPVADDGSLGAWTSGTKLPIGIAGMGVVVTHGEVILAAGYQSKHTYTSAIQADGSLGAWTKGPDVSQILFHAAAVAHGDFLYVIGGIDDTMTSDEVQRSAIAADGSLGAFETIAHLPYTLSHHVAVVDSDTLYVIGGQTGNVNINAGTPHKETQIASFAADGSLSAWTQGPDLVVASETSAGLVHDGYVYVVAGVDDTNGEASGKPSKKVQRARISAPGQLEPWAYDDASALPSPVSHVHQLPVYRDHVYSASGERSGTDVAAVNVGQFK